MSTWKKPCLRIIRLIAFLAAIVAIPHVLGIHSPFLPERPPIAGEKVDHWKTAQGKIKGYHFFQALPGHPGGLTLFYTYAIDGKSYDFETFWYHPTDINAQETQNAHPTGSSIEVNYDPENPQRSYVLKLPSGVMY